MQAEAFLPEQQLVALPSALSLLRGQHAGSFTEPAFSALSLSESSSAFVLSAAILSQQEQAVLADFPVGASPAGFEVEV
jgi:hypothetical protein